MPVLRWLASHHKNMNTIPHPDQVYPPERSSNKPKSINQTPHLNRSKVKQTALEIAKMTRPTNKFSRVGLAFLQRIEAKTMAAIREEVRLHPSKGKTLL
jgi:hypothetical protein